MASVSTFKQEFRESNNVLLVCYLLNVDGSECYEGLVLAINSESKTILVVEDDDSNIYYSYLHYAHCVISSHRNSISGYRFAEALILGTILL